MFGLNKMWLLQVNVWGSPAHSGHYDQYTVTQEAFLSRRPFKDAVDHIELYRRLYALKYDYKSIRFALIGVQRVPEFSSSMLDHAGISIIEDECDRIEEYLMSIGKLPGSRTDNNRRHVRES